MGYGIRKIDQLFLRRAFSQALRHSFVFLAASQPRSRLQLDSDPGSSAASRSERQQQLSRELEARIDPSWFATGSSSTPLPHLFHACGHERDGDGGATTQKACDCAHALAILLQCLFELDRSHEIEAFAFHFYGCVEAMPFDIVFLWFVRLYPFWSDQHLNLFLFVSVELQIHQHRMVEAQNTLISYLKIQRAQIQIHRSSQIKAVSLVSLGQYRRLVEVLVFRVLLEHKDFQPALQLVQADDLLSVESKMVMEAEIRNRFARESAQSKSNVSTHEEETTSSSTSIPTPTNAPASQAGSNKLTGNNLPSDVSQWKALVTNILSPKALISGSPLRPVAAILLGGGASALVLLFSFFVLTARRKTRKRLQSTNDFQRSTTENSSARRRPTGNKSSQTPTMGGRVSLWKSLIGLLENIVSGYVPPSSSGAP